jgi:hypothetical protein
MKASMLFFWKNAYSLTLSAAMSAISSSFMAEERIVEWMCPRYH